MKLTPEQIAAPGTEAAIQTALFAWAASVGIHLLYAIPNGEQRSKITGARLKQQGVKAGFPDIGLPMARRGFNGLFIELKKKGGLVAHRQQNWLDMLNAEGYKAVTCFGYEEARDCLKWYLSLPPET